MSQQLGLDLDDAPKKPRRGALRSFHARGHVRPEEALAGEARNRGQEESIHAWIRDQGEGRRFTPREVHAAFPGLELTSVRRALSDLTKAARLVHHDEDLRRGPKGTESTWGIA